MAFGFRISGAPANAVQSSLLKAALLNDLADLEGHEICQTFWRQADPAILREEVTVDGQRRRDLEVVYRLGAPGQTFSLRADPEPEKGQIL